MKAAQYNSYGGPEVIAIHTDVLRPTLQDGQVLVEVHAASINPFDYKLRLGYMKEMIRLHFPVTIGGDFAGIVSEVGPGVIELNVGDEVYGQALVINGGSGSLAEFASAKTKNTAKKPHNLDFTQSASLVLVGISAIQALEEHIKLTRGQKILIHGGAGGIGSIAIQLAKHIGAFVATTVSEKDKAFVTSLGADEVIDYKTQKFETIIKDYDAVYDAVGKTIDESYGVLKKGGVLVSMSQIDEKKAQAVGITAIGQMSGTTTARLDRLRELVEANIVKPQIDKTFPLDEARAAYEYLETSHPKGKVVVTIKA